MTAHWCARMHCPYTCDVCSHLPWWIFAWYCTTRSECCSDGERCEGHWLGRVYYHSARFRELRFVTKQGGYAKREHVGEVRDERFQATNSNRLPEVFAVVI